jgi:large subunit ribosomal protein L10
MAITKAKKQTLLEELHTIMKQAGSVVFVHVKGLGVNTVAHLRRGLQSNDASYKVVKKTLLKKALAESGFSGTMPALDNEIAIAYSSDLIAPAREVYEFQKANKDKVSIVGGIFEGKFMDQAEMLSIATIPPTQVLRGMFVNVINSPIQGLVIALSKIAEKKES